MGFGVALIRLLVAAVVTVWPAGFVNAADLLLFAASSMAEPSRALIEQFEARHGRQVNLSTAGTATLVRQLNAGAPADVLITADRAWMDAAIESGVVDPETVVVIASNRLSLVAPAELAEQPIELSPKAFEKRLANDRFAMADPTHVPAGRYARQALESLGLWAVVAERQVRADNVRAALAFVARGEVPLGIVYSTDARADPAVREILLLPEDSHSQIQYLAALTNAGTAPGKDLLAFLTGADARDVLKSFGFLPPKDTGTTGQ